MLLVPQKKKIIMMFAGSPGEKHEPFVQKLGEESGAHGFDTAGEESKDDPMEALVAAMEAFKSAFASESPRGMAMAFRDAIDICECLPPDADDDYEHSEV